MTLQDDMDAQDSPEKFIHAKDIGVLHMRRRVGVGILGATGSVGQMLISLLDNHPWFDITAVAASEKSEGKLYKEAVNWRQSKPISEKVANLELKAAKPDLDCRIVFSALDSSVAKEIETEFANAGYVVISCARAHRMDSKVPLLIPEVNIEHLELLKSQDFPKKGLIIAKPNCAVIGLCLALRPLQLEFGVEAVNVVTMQAISGAGYPGVPSMAITDNIIPFIAGEEDRLVEEPPKIFGSCNMGKITPYPITVSPTATRVPVTDGHMEVVSVKLKQKVTLEQIKRAWNEFSPAIDSYHLPSSCKKSLYYFEENEFPQPRLHRDLERGMAVSLGRLRPDPLLDYKFVCLLHNTIRGAAGGAILIAELLVNNGHVFW